jgi:hypothetical protein
MKKIEECLDLVLKTLIENGDSLCIYEVENLEAYNEKKWGMSPAYKRLFDELGLNKKETKQLLEILKEKEYLTFEMVTGVLYGSIFLKVKSDNTIGNTVFDNTMSDLVGRPNKMEITLKGKFFILEGGFTGKHKKEEREALLQRLAIWITAIGTGLGGLYLIGKALIWFSSLMY